MRKRGGGVRAEHSAVCLSVSDHEPPLAASPGIPRSDNIQFNLLKPTAIIEGKKLITVLYLILRMEKINFNFEKRAFFW